MTEEPRPAGRVFLAPETPQPQRRAVAERLMADHPEVFGKPEDAIGLLRSIHLPASLRWAFLNNGKAGTSSARRFLFQMEFGVPLTVNWDVPHDINPDGVVHSLQGGLVSSVRLSRCPRRLRCSTGRCVWRRCGIRSAGPFRPLNTSASRMICATAGSCRIACA